MTVTEQALIDKIKQLPPERMAEVEDFVDFLRAREDEHRLTHAATRASEASFAQVWDNDEDAAYDRMWCPMATTPRFSFGDVVLVPFPFTDQSGTKKRPAAVVSSASYNASRRDIVIMAITSQVRMPLAFGEAMVGDWHAAGLIKPSVLKPVFTTIEQHLVVRTLGRLNAADDKALREVIGDVIG
jgi:mRNA interferase MazF